MRFPSLSVSYARAVLATVLLLLPAACSHQPAAKHYELQGRVVAVDRGLRQLTVAHEDIPGLMKAMTMPFLVNKRELWVFRAIAPGDQIHATLVLGDQAELRDITFTRISELMDKPPSPLHLPQPGEAAPDFTLINQAGKTIDLQQFGGKPLLLTFLYTRCPFPDYCPRLSHNFQQVLQKLKESPNALRDAQLLSISIDPENDTSAALRRYGERYVAGADPSFQHWQFASGTPEQVRKLADIFGLAYNEQDGQIVHGLTTVLIGKNGKVLKVYSGNAWKPEDVAADMVAAQAD